MLNISVEKSMDSVISIAPMSIKRDWMDATPEKHAYRCFPVTQANMVGWYLYSNKDVEFTWNGINDTSSDNIQITKGVSMLTINPVNYFNEDFETMSSLISTSWLDVALPLAIKARTANKNIVIKAGTPLATIIPISLTSMNDTDINIFDYSDPDRKRERAHMSYGEAAQEINKQGKWTDWYRDAVNEKGESLGSHETKVIRLSVSDNTKNRNDIM